MPARRFRFGLQKVLDLREWEEKQAENNLAAKTGQCTTCEAALQALHVRQHGAFLHRSAAGLDITLLAVHDAFRLRMLRDIETKEKELARLTLEREELLAVYLAARRRREILTKLSEKQALGFRQAEAKRDALVLDDLNTAAFIRKMRAMTQGEARIG